MKLTPACLCLAVVFVLPGGTVTFTASATLSAAATGTLSNTATVTAPAGVPDPAPGNNSSTDVDTILRPTDLAITKTDGQTTAAPGQVLTYTIVVSNNGPSPGPAMVWDNVPTSLTGVTWTCVGASGGTCTASGTAAIADTVNLPVGGSVTYTLTGTVAANPIGLTNTATVYPSYGIYDSNPANDSATDDDLLVCNPQIFVIADGRVTPHTIAASATEWFAMGLRLGNSYSLEFKNATGNGTPPGALTLFKGDDGCTGTSHAVVRNTAAIDPGTGTAAARISFTATGGSGFYRAELVNGAGSPIDYTFSLSDTTMYSATWSTSGAFNTYYSLQNTTGATLNATLTLRDTAGAVLTTFSTPIPAGQTISTNTSALGTTRNRFGTAKLTHDGPPGALSAEAAVANFSTNPAYVQPVKLQAVREAPH